MKRILAIILILAFSASLLCNITFFADAEEIQNIDYEEIKVTVPEFSKDKYYKIYDRSGKAVTYVNEGASSAILLRDPEEGNKAQEWQIAADPAFPSKYRIISKLKGEALQPSGTSQVELSTVDLNSVDQEWSFSLASGGVFNIRVGGKNRLTYSQDKVKITATTSAAKQFEIYEINEPGWVEDFVDEFNGDLDESKWNRADGHLQGSDALVTNVGDKEHVYTENGNLVLKTTVGEYGGYDAAAGMVDTAGKYYISFGKVEMRAKLPKGFGTFPALWMLGTENIWPGNGEIDIMEISNDGGADKDSYLYGTLHWSNDTGGHVGEGKTLYNEARVPLAEDYHTYTMEWEYDQIRMYFDGTLYFSFNIDNDVKRFAYGDEPHFLILDNWLLGNSKGQLLEGKEYESEYLFIIDSIKTYKREGTAEYIPDETTEATTVNSTAADVIARSHDWDNRMPIAVSPDGKELAAADGLGMLHIVDAESMLTKERILTFPMSELSALAYSPDGEKLAVANLIGTILIYDVSDYSAEPLRICNGSVNCEQLIFTADSTRLIVSGISRRAYHYGGANQFDGQYVEPKAFRVFETSSGEKLFETALGGEARGMCLSDDGKTLALALLDGKCVLVETEDFSVTGKLDCGKVQLHGVDISADGTLLAASDEAGEIYLWDIEKQTLIRKFETKIKTSITQAVFSDDGKRLIVNSTDSCARVYDVETGKVTVTLGGFNGLVRHVAYSPDGSFIAVGSYDGRIKLFSAAGEYIRTLVTSHTEHNGRVFSMSFSPDGEYIYASVYSYPKALHKWRVDGTEGDSSAEFKCDFDYEISDGEAKIKAYRGNERDIVIPAYIDGYPVTAIGKNAFFYYGNCIRNVSITLPETLVRIESRAFYNVWSLKRVHLPHRLEYIGDDAFHGCKQLYEIVIPDSVTHIGKGAFDWCHGLKRVVVGGGVKNLLSGTFGSSRGITEVFLRSGVERIESKAFSVSELERVVFADSVSYCADDAFEGNGYVYGSSASYAEEYADSVDGFGFKELLIGDSDGDGVITVVDALCVLRASVGLTYGIAEIEDMDADGEVTVSDALRILRKCAGIL